MVFAALLAFYPWHVRYSSEARGYTFLPLFLTLALWYLIEALESGRWRWWILFAVVQFGALYSWKAAIHPLMATNIIALVIILRTRGFGQEGILQLGRWAAANGGTLMAFVPLFMPAVYQIHRKLTTSIQEGGSVHADWFKNVAARFLRGTDGIPQELETPFDSMGAFLARWPVPDWMALIVVVFSLGAGGWRLLTTNWKLAALPGGPALGVTLALAHFQLNGNYLQIWYVFYATPALMAFVAKGESWLFDGWGEGRLGRIGVGLSALGVVALSILFWRPMRDFARFPVQDPRGASEVTRYGDEGRWYLGPSDILTVGFYRRCVLYDPRIKQFLVVDGKKHRLRTAELLKNVMKEIDEASDVMAPSKLRVSIANVPFAELDNPDYIELVRNDRFFSPMRVFPAVEDYIEIEDYEYKAGSLTLHEGKELR